MRFESGSATASCGNRDSAMTVGEEYVTGWEGERVHRGGMRGGLPPRETTVPLSPLHAVLSGDSAAVCGARTPHVDLARPWRSTSMGLCPDCRSLAE